jgi:hypothetical protein
LREYEDNRVLIPAYPRGEVKRGDRELVGRGKAVDTFGDKVFVRRDPDAAVTAFAPVTDFLEFLKANGLWRQWVEDGPLNYLGGNAPPKQDILGALLLSALAGHRCRCTESAVEPRTATRRPYRSPLWPTAGSRMKAALAETIEALPR